MKKKQHWPETRKVKPEPCKNDIDWVIWAAWADRITFEEIEERTGLSETKVITIMRKHQRKSSFIRWRKRVSNRSTKHRKKFTLRKKSEQKKYPEDKFRR